MTAATHIYDLTLVLDPQGEDDSRAKIVADARAAIEAQGELVRYDDWGERPLAYPIERRATGEYHLLQFRPTDKELLFGLDRTLRITDGILRFRIIKLPPGIPDAPDLRATPAPRRDAEAPASPPATPSADAEQPPAGAEGPAAAVEEPAVAVSAGEPAAAVEEPAVAVSAGEPAAAVEEPAAVAEPAPATEPDGTDPGAAPA